MEAFMDLKDYLQETYVKEHNKHWKCEYQVGKETHVLTIFTNKQGALAHCDNLGMTLCLSN